jgi:putative resolvase
VFKVKLTDWAKKQGIHYRTAWNYFKAGKINGAYKLHSGAIIVPEESQNLKKEYITVYARVSSSENKTNLDSQAIRLVEFCNAKGWIVNEIVKEVGSGINDKRKKLNRIFKEGKSTKIVVEHKDRLSRFGTNFIEKLLTHMKCELIILNPAEDKEDLMQDFVAIVTSFCSKIYGLRRSKRNTEKLISSLNKSSE